jgi:hypothetical protein
MHPPERLREASEASQLELKAEGGGLGHPRVGQGHRLTDHLKTTREDGTAGPGAQYVPFRKTSSTEKAFALGREVNWEFAHAALDWAPSGVAEVER